MELLIAMPQLQDPNFKRTIMLLTEFSKKGAMGFILNRPLKVSKDDFVNHEGEKIPLEGDLSTFWGGPVQNELGFIIHEDEEFQNEGVELSDKLFLSGSMETLNALLKKQKMGSSLRFRFFLGYSGWSPGQLEGELSESTWISMPVTKEALFDESSDDLWQKSIDEMGIDVSQLTSVTQKLAH